VVAVPLVGCVPLQPPEAAQDCALVVVHFSVVEEPGATLGFIATSEMAGIAALAAALRSTVSPVAELPHAAKVENTAPAIAKRDKRSTMTNREGWCSPEK
jgi:hypothetical protein